MNLFLEDFSYDLPPERIAQQPSRFREGARLMVLGREEGHPKDTVFSRIQDYLKRGDLLVLNDSAVQPVRLRGVKKATGGRVEALLLARKGGGLRVRLEF